jgi:hypothetical protein
MIARKSPLAFDILKSINSNLHSADKNFMAAITITHKARKAIYS